MTSNDKNDFFDLFRNKKVSAYVIAGSAADPQLPKKEDFLMRKINSEQVAVPVWRDNVSAQDFLGKHLPPGDMKVLKIDWDTLWNYLELYPENERKHIVLNVL